MSQFYVNNSSLIPPPPTVATSYVTDVNSPAIPAANILDVFGGETTANNNNGIRTDGSSGSNVLTVQLTNRLQGTGTTVGATTADIVTFSLGATPGTFFFTFQIAAFESGTPSGAGYGSYSTARTTGIAATIIGDTDSVVHEEAALLATDFNLVASGNNVILRVTGAAGLTIDWSIVGYYVRAT